MRCLPVRLGSDDEIAPGRVVLTCLAASSCRERRDAVRNSLPVRGPRANWIFAKGRIERASHESDFGGGDPNEDQRESPAGRECPLGSRSPVQDDQYDGGPDRPRNEKAGESLACHRGVTTLSFSRNS